MKGHAEDGRKVEGEPRASTEERLSGVGPEETRDAARKEAEEAAWMSMATGDPALFIKDSE